MLFNSYIFIFAFLPITLIGYFVLNRFSYEKAAKVWLVIASFVFYGYFNMSYLFIIISSIVFNFSVNKLFNTKRFTVSDKLRKILLVIGLTANVGVLFVYKYLDFVLSGVNALFKTDLAYMNLILPLGISFFTFQQLSYLIDSYKKKVPDYDFLDYSLFVTFFPQLIAGPIVLHSEVIPQFEDKKNLKFNTDNFAKGLYAFALGLSKKVIIADNFGKIVTYGYSHIDSLNGFEALLAILAYTFQIYFDFSGYCDMASGIALMFNIKLPVNFDSPYKATNISDFWKRWHKTLTRFLTTYIYFPLGGSRCSKSRTYLNILIVFIVSGIWHGAGWTFILWGLLHGCAMVIYRAFKGAFEKVPKAIMWVLNFIFINASWVLFRAESITDAVKMFEALARPGFTINAELSETLFNIIPISIITNAIDIKYILNYVMIAVVIIFVFVCIKCKNVQERIPIFTPKASNALTTCFLLLYGILSLSGVSTFLYFNF